MSRPPLIAHVLYHFGVGGLENGVVNLINHTPPGRYRHAIVSLTGATDFRQRLRDPQVPVICLEKPPGPGWKLFPRLYRLFRDLQPAVVHSRNLAALEAQLPATLAGVPARVHGEHGRDVGDLDGSNRRLRLVRRAYRPFVHRYVALSRDLHDYLVHRVGFSASAVEHICNGVDSERFRPDSSAAGLPFPAGSFVIGAVGRMQAVKSFMTLVEAFIRLRQSGAPHAPRLRLVILGDGRDRAPALERLARAGLAEAAWLPGERSDVPALLPAFDVLVLPSLAEGISNTILEAMACGLPVVATAVGGNPELVREGVTGALVAPADAAQLADAIGRYAADPATARAHGRTARALTEEHYALDVMVNRYLGVYDRLLGERDRI